MFYSDPNHTIQVIRSVLLYPLSYEGVWCEKESNLQPFPYQRNALPLSYRTKSKSHPEEPREMCGLLRWLNNSEALHCVVYSSKKLFLCKFTSPRYSLFLEIVSYSFSSLETISNTSSLLKCLNPPGRSGATEPSRSNINNPFFFSTKVEGCSRV